jgi:hypothetical protein
LQREKAVKRPGPKIKVGQLLHLLQVRQQLMHPCSGKVHTQVPQSKVLQLRLTQEDIWLQPKSTGSPMDLQTC